MYEVSQRKRCGSHTCSFFSFINLYPNYESEYQSINTTESYFVPCTVGPDILS